MNMNWSSPSTQTSKAYFLLFVVVLWKGAAIVSCDRCFSTTNCRGSAIPRIDTGRDCCLNSAGGFSYDIGDGDEVCYRCEVIGWKDVIFYVVPNWVAPVTLGAVRGMPAGRYLFRVQEMTNHLGATFVNSAHETQFLYGEHNDMDILIKIPSYDDSMRYHHKNATYRLIRIFPDSLEEGKYFNPQEVILHLIVPRISISKRRYLIGYWDPIPVCLEYNNTVGFASFSANITITRSDGKFSQKFEYEFNRHSGRSCTSLRLPRHAIRDPFSETTFTVELDSRESYDLGGVKTSSLTVSAVIAPTVEFGVSEDIVVELPFISEKVCLNRLLSDNSDENSVSFSVTVSLSIDFGNTSELSFDFGESAQTSCKNMSVILADMVVESSVVLTLVILPPEDLSYRIGMRNWTLITVNPASSGSGSGSGSGEVEVDDGGDNDRGGGGGGGGGDGGDKDKDDSSNDKEPDLDIGDLGDSREGLSGGSNSNSGLWVIIVSVTVSLAVIGLIAAAVIVISFLAYKTKKSSPKTVGPSGEEKEKA